MFGAWGCICGRCGIKDLLYFEHYADDPLLELHYAVGFGADRVDELDARLSGWRHLVHMQSPRFRTPLMLAAGTAKFNLVRGLLAAGSSPNAVDEVGNTALHYAVSAAVVDEPAARLCVDALCDRAGTNVNAGARASCCGIEGETALMRASDAGLTSIVKRLLAAEARVGGAHLPCAVFFPITRRSGFPWSLRWRRRALAALHAPRAGGGLCEDLAVVVVGMACRRE